ncbi:hypothetical protein BDR22DRAFT_885010 [Usnea florida]
MKYSIIASALVQLVSLASAAAISARQEFEVGITFIGEGSDPSTYFQQFPTDDQPYPIDNPLIVSQISSVGGGFCVFTGLNGSSTVVFGEETVDVVPPQVQVQGDCQSA